VLATIIITVALSALLLVWSLAFAVRNRAVILKQLLFGAVIEAGLLVQAGIAAVGSWTGREVVDPVLFWGYLIVALMLLPVAALVAFAERSRWSSIVMIVATFTIIVMEIRLWQVWSI